MNWENRCLQVGAAALLLAVLIRISGPVGNFLIQMDTRKAAAIILFLETGQWIEPMPPPPVCEIPEETQGEPQPVPALTEPLREPVNPTDAQNVSRETLPYTPPPAMFSPEDQQTVQIKNHCSFEPDIPAMLEAPLHWNLLGAEPTVLILHTHGTESYENTEGYKEITPYRSEDIHYNIVSIGELVAQELRQQGISVLHDKTLHDLPSYSKSYDVSRIAAAEYLKQYPSIRMVLDIHRDAAENEAGRQVCTTVQVNGEESAKLMLVVGTNGSGLYHPNWRENLSLAVKLQVCMERNAPGICRPIHFRAQRFNQDLSPGFLLVEVGTAGNTRQQALRAAHVLAKGIEELAGGSQNREGSPKL